MDNVGSAGGGALAAMAARRDAEVAPPPLPKTVTQAIAEFRESEVRGRVKGAAPEFTEQLADIRKADPEAFKQPSPLARGVLTESLIDSVTRIRNIEAVGATADLQRKQDEARAAYFQTQQGGAPQSTVARLFGA